MSNLEYRLSHGQGRLGAEQLKQQRLLYARNAPVALGLTGHKEALKAQKIVGELREAREAWSGANLPFEELFSQLHINQKLDLLARFLHAETNIRWKNLGETLSEGYRGYNAYLDGKIMTYIFDHRIGRVPKGNGGRKLSSLRQLNDIITARVYTRAFKSGSNFEYYFGFALGFNYWQKMKAPYIIGSRTCFEPEVGEKDAIFEFKLPFKSMRGVSHRLDNGIIDVYDACMLIGRTKNVAGRVLT